MKKVFFLTALLIMANCASLLYAVDVPTTNPAANSQVRPGREVRRINLKEFSLIYHLMDLSGRGEMMKMTGHHAVIGPE